MCELVDEAEHGILQSPISLPHSLPNILDGISNRLRLNLPERAVPPGKRRIRWTCSCGLRLYDDFDEQLDGGTLDELENRLNTRTLASRKQSESTNIASQALVRSVQLFWSRLRGQTDSALHTHATPTTTTSDSSRESESKELLYLLHCRSTGEYGIRLDQDLIPDNLNDQELFKFLRIVYCRARQGAKWFTLRNTISISLCKFFVDHSYHVSLCKHEQECMQRQTKDCICLPPRELVGREYQCRPPDPMPLPPFEKNFLMHYFLNPDHVSPDQTWVYQQLPKRMNGPLLPEHDAFLPGWGIYFEDDWNWMTIYFLILLAIIVGSLILGVCWSMVKLDVQDVFGFIYYWVVVVTMGLGFLALRSIDKL
ncbi:hypothetical protein NKR23_g8969 [Pleurostoma richardsiae]|uniref:Uncharacterized protein n=1 Tax=Pleurostoma richardsiae TaxID=41990 RepID=A0AA38RGU7_9PEZI|nr:hypothetical protein NKR23_g8969 [Pleurostoma richardsiae]